jgi:hypothetical protein
MKCSNSIIILREKRFKPLSQNFQSIEPARYNSWKQLQSRNSLSKDISGTNILIAFKPKPSPERGEGQERRNLPLLGLLGCIFHGLIV